MIRSFLKKNNIDNNYFIDDLFVFTDESNKYSFLLNKKGCSMIVDEYLLNSIKNKNLDENLKFKLLNHGLATMKQPKINVVKRKNKNIYFIIDVTKKCNFDCVYCFRNLNDKRVIDNNTLKDICLYILNVVKQRKLKNVTIQVWGGEPLLAIDKLEFVYNYFKDTNIKVKIDIESNGSLITDKIAKRLHDMNVHVGISIDGMKKHQDIQRKLVGGHSSNSLVKKGIENLRKYYGNDISGIAVITKYNYQDIASIINYFTGELKIYNMKFNLVKDNPNANEDRIGLSLNEVSQFADNLFDVVELYNLMGVRFNEGNIQMRLNNLKERSNNSYCISNGCKGGINLISIDMNGDIYPCEMMDYANVKIGSIYQNQGLSTNKDLVNQIKKSKKTNIFFKNKVNKECSSCPWFYFCQGGCTSRVVYSEGKMKYDEVECVFNKAMYEKIVNHILKNITGGK